jgi:hypothetical protein
MLSPDMILRAFCSLVQGRHCEWGQTTLYRIPCHTANSYRIQSGNLGKLLQLVSFTVSTVFGISVMRFTTINTSFSSFTRGAASTKSWLFKRNYTFSIMDDGSKGSSWWDATGKQFTTGKYTFKNLDPNDYSSIVCGINIFGHDEYYKMPQDGKSAPFNGMCLTGKRETSEQSP